MKEYCTIATDIASATIVIEKSRFVAYAKGVDSVEDAVEFVNTISKTNYNATHNCYAYIVGDKAKFSDNGEPQGTAGMPILECIKNNGLDKVAVVVTRYFGGIKLGAGGLVRAYTASCAEVLRSCTKLNYCQCQLIDITVDYNLLGIVKKALEGKVVVKDTVFDNKVTLQCLILQKMQDTITDIVVDITLGKAIVTVRQQLLCPYGG